MEKIFVYGLGSLGSNLLLQLAKKYPDIHFIGIDYDKVEDRNVGIQAYFLEHVNVPKVIAMSAVLQRFNRKSHYTPKNVEIKCIKDLDAVINEFGDKNSLLIDCVDNSKSRAYSTYTKESKLETEVIHVGFSPHLAAEIIWDEKYTVPGPVDPNADDICEVRDAIPFIGFVVNLASMIISDYIDEGVKDNYIIVNRFDIRKI